MCGFCGFTGLIATPEEILEKMKNKIVHRGPDSGGSHIDTGIAMGFRRLSFLDLEGGHQPIYNETRDMVITFNGEIYNHQEIREELEAKGHVMGSHADTEVLIHGYEEWGEEILQKLRGMFAFVIWDKKNETLFGARDFFGIKPFYYTLADGNFIYGSEIKSILEHPAVKKEVNPEALENYLTFQYSVLEETFFKGIFKLMPAHCFTFKNGKLDIKRYWEPVFEPDNSKTLDQWVDEIDAAMQDSIQAHKIADVEVGCFLSSGVDSSYVSTYFADQKTFTVGFDAEYPPYGYRTEDGDYAGFDLDLAAEVCARQGWELVKQPIDWNAKDMELNSGAIDCIWNGFTMNGREDSYLFSEPYVDNSIVYVVNADSDIQTEADLAGKYVITQAGSSALAALQDKADVVATFAALDEIADYNTAFMNLEAGTNDAIAVDIGVAQYQLQTKADKFRMLEEPLSTEQYAIGFRMDDTELRDTVQATLNEMVEDGTFMEIASKYADYNLDKMVCLGK